MIEEVSSSGEQFGPRRLETLVGAHRDIPLQGSVQALLEAVVTWHGNGRLRDDVSILAAEVLA